MNEDNYKILPGLMPLAVPIDSVHSMKGNPRRGDIEAVARSLNRFGQHRPYSASTGSACGTLN